jgi:hypothetical protein
MGSFPPQSVTFAQTKRACYNEEGGQRLIDPSYAEGRLFIWKI